MYFPKHDKRGQSIVSDETIKWIIYIAIFVAVGFAVKTIVSRVSG